jgi:predicted GTPase
VGRRNNDTPFYYPDAGGHFDPHRPGHELLTIQAIPIFGRYCSDQQMDSADAKNIEQVRKNIEKHRPKAQIVLADSAISVEGSDQIRGKRAWVVEDGPTLTHGEMTYGAGGGRCQKIWCTVIVDPRPFITGTIKKTFEKYPNIGAILPAMGYSKEQIHDLERPSIGGL